MIDKIYLDEIKEKFKGNLHLHTTWSDGCFDAGKVVTRYKELDYDFICFSDHDIYTRTAEFNTTDFITLPGMERGGLNPYLETNDNPGFHFTILDDPNCDVEKRFAHLQKFNYPQEWQGEESVLACIKEMRENGNLVILNHPEWHMTPFEVMEKYDFFALEIYNHATEWNHSSGYGTAYWDYALQHNKRLFGIAADDAHDYRSDLKVTEYGGGWIVVDGNQLNQEEVMKNIIQGNYYSSSGPEIYDFRVENGRVKIKCSKVQCIMFKSWPVRGDFLIDRQGDFPFTQASMEINSLMKYIRVECIDYNGKIAWTNPIFLEDLR